MRSTVWSTCLCQIPFLTQPQKVGVVLGEGVNDYTSKPPTGLQDLQNIEIIVIFQGNIFSLIHFYLVKLISCSTGVESMITVKCKKSATEVLSEELKRFDQWKLNKLHPWWLIDVFLRFWVFKFELLLYTFPSMLDYFIDIVKQIIS